MIPPPERSANNPLGVPADRLATGVRVGGARYALKRRVGRGEASEVWVAWDRTREEDVIVKFFPPSLLQDAPTVEQLKSEAARTQPLHHPAIARVYDLVLDLEYLGIAMEIIEGWSLAALRVDRPQNRYRIEEILAWLQQVCPALDYAHGLSVVHRDLKPSNLMLDPREHIKLTDFALAAVAQSGLLRQGWPPTASAAYCSPQQLAGEEPSWLDDVYSLGATLYELLTSTPPFYEGDILAQALEETPPLMTGRLVQLNFEGNFPALWEGAVAACLAKDPARRPQSAGEVLARLTRTEPPRRAELREARQPQPPRRLQPGASSTAPAAGAHAASELASESQPTPASAPVEPLAPSAGAPSTASATPASTSAPPESPAAEPVAADLAGAAGPDRKRRRLLTAAVLVVVALGLLTAFTVGTVYLVSRAKTARPLAALPGSLDASFDPGTGADDDIRALVLLPDGKLLVGGRFAHFDDSAISGVARLKPDGRPERTFAPRIAGAVHALALQSDGKIVVGGDFSNVNDQPHRHIARLLPDGNLDESFGRRAGVNHEIRALLVQPDGRLLAGGSFTSFFGHKLNRVVRLDADGSVDRTFNPGAGADKIVWGFALQADGKVLVVGDFTRFDNQPHGGVVRLNPDGSLDRTFACSGADAPVRAVCLLPGGKILLGGEFLSLNHLSCPRIARLNPDGAIDPSLKPGAGPDAGLRALTADRDGGLVIAGAFTHVQGLPRNGVAWLNADGTPEPRYAADAGPLGGAVWCLGLQPDGALLLGGTFTNCSGAARNRIARLHGTR